ncbi:MAG TPA: lysophospholipid acyltransferase family protein [Candidatus Omnitrophota bacterium]|nr:lysophospholipid acyltransferase family protein [Candidatus Omnitrophota bacterium]HPS37721.1 lysophospholipid acyltransferase family protein [Candidatus Omnitrophota bacterium]
MNAFLSLFFWVACVVLTATLFFVELFLKILLFPFDRQARFLHRQCFWWSDGVIGMNPFWQLTVRGLENADPKKTYVIVANHQSLGDIAVLYQTRLQFKWVAKESLFSIPFLGWCLSLCKHIKLRRGDQGSIRNVYREAIDYLKAGMSVLFFPEGTRSETHAMNPFQSGAFKLAITEKIPVLPIAIDGTRDAIPKGDWIMRTKVFCTLTVLEPIETAGMSRNDVQALSETVRARIAAHLKS